MRSTAVIAKLARHLEERVLGYVLGIASTRRVSVDAVHQASAAQIAADQPRRVWERRSAGAGAHGSRWYDWAWVDIHPRIAAHRDGAPVPQAKDGPDRRSWSLLIRRHPRTAELAYYLCHAPGPTSLTQLIAVAGRRWSIEEGFQATKGLAGLDEYQVRGWKPWRRWTLLAMLAHALLAVITAIERATAPPPRAMIALTCAEVRRLLTTALPRAIDPERALAWSRWRRSVQHRARLSHYAARGETYRP